ncbi:MAG TPA: YbaK/EbsC family protein, partial [Polyangia bacterium]
MAIEMPGKLTSFFDQNAVPYRVIHHAPEYTAQEAAQCTHTPGQEFAKSVVLRIDESYAFAVAPASARLDLERIRAATGARSV